MFRAEGVPLDLDTAGLASRLLARTLDFVVSFGGVYLLLTALAITTPPLWLMIVTIVVSFFVAVFVYPAVLETTMRGRTVGKLNVDDPTLTGKNSWLREPEAWDPPTAAYLSGELWTGFATVRADQDWL